MLKAFNEVSNNKILCHEICGQNFKSLEDHTVYIKQGGCKTLIEVLANS